MDAQAVLPEFPSQLAHAFNKWERFNVTDSTPYLGDYEIKVAGIAEQHYVTFNLISYVRYYLHGFAKIVTAALFIYYTLVYSSGSYIVGLGCVDISEALIVPEVEIGLMSINSNIALAVLIWVECAWVDIDIRVKLLYCDAIPPGFKQAGKRCGNNSFSE